MKRDLPCPITIGEFNRLVKNLNVCKNINEEQNEWLEYYMDKNNYKLKDVVLKLDENNVLFIIINTTNSVRQFTN